MSIALNNVLQLPVAAKVIYKNVFQKIYEGKAYIYWMPDDEAAQTYLQRLNLGLNMWNQYSGFAQYYNGLIISNETTVGYVVQAADSYLNDSYGKVAQRMISPFMFYLPDSNTWQYFNTLWLPFYQRILSKLIDSNLYIPSMSLENMAIYNNVLYYEWLFDTQTIGQFRTGAVHPLYEAALTMFQANPTSLNAALQNIAADIYAGGSTPPF